MSLSLTEHPLDLPQVAKAASELLGRPVDSAELIGQGRNSRVYRLSGPDGDAVMKFYFQSLNNIRHAIRKA